MSGSENGSVMLRHLLSNADEFVHLHGEAIAIGLRFRSGYGGGNIRRPVAFGLEEDRNVTAGEVGQPLIGNATVDDQLDFVRAPRHWRGETFLRRYGQPYVA